MHSHGNAGANRYRQFFPSAGAVVDYKKTRLLSAEDAAYIAGLIDGEGTITLQRRHKGENRRLAVTISSTERPMLEYVQSVTGVGNITSKRTYSDRHAQSYTYGVYSRQALNLLEQIHSNLRSYKKRRSRLALEQYVALTPRNGKYTDDVRKRREEFERELLDTKPKGVREHPAGYDVSCLVSLLSPCPGSSPAP